ncbi:MAG: hypothetical protein ACRDKL_09750 [Solirubrobacteraceae bacterium]
MSPRKQASTPSPAQLSYLRDLASQTGTTFTLPQSGYQAGREIKRLKDLKARRGRYLETPRLDLEPAEQPYATEQKPGEIVGYGATARRGDPAPRPAAAPQQPSADEPFELGHYVTRCGEDRALYGIRVEGQPRIIDAAAHGAGRIYTVEQDLREHGGYGELRALVADYLEQAQRLGRIPMAPAQRRHAELAADA